MLPANLTRWIVASVTDYLQTNKGSYSLYTESETPAGKEYAELRLDGPRSRKVHNMYSLTIDVGILCTIILDTDIYKPHSMVGHFQSKLDSEITVRKFGEPGNPILGCLRPVGDIDILQYGFKNAETKAFQIGVEASFKMELNNGSY